MELVATECAVKVPGEEGCYVMAIYLGRFACEPWPLGVWFCWNLDLIYCLEVLLRY